MGPREVQALLRPKEGVTDKVRPLYKTVPGRLIPDDYPLRLVGANPLENILDNLGKGTSLYKIPLGKGYLSNPGLTELTPSTLVSRYTGSKVIAADGYSTSKPALKILPYH